jgi:hypothetical protein
MPQGKHDTHASGPSNGRWRGGVTWTNGYAWVCRPGPHPRKHKGAVRRATLVLENKIGRFLANGECAHHLDQNKANDSPDNLLLMTTEEHNRVPRRVRTTRCRLCVVCGEVVTRPRFRAAIERTTCNAVCRNRLLAKTRPTNWNHANGPSNPQWKDGSRSNRT